MTGASWPHPLRVIAWSARWQAADVLAAVSANPDRDRRRHSRRI
jgi:hypothetical protein